VICLLSITFCRKTHVEITDQRLINTAYNHQLRWRVYQFDDVDLFAQASESTEANGGRKLDTAFVEVKEDIEVTKEKTMVSTSTAETTQVAPSEVAPASTVTSKPSSKVKMAKRNIEAVPDKKEPPKQTKMAPKDPYTKYKVSSWWKWGSNQQMLENDINGCKATLGEKHHPDFEKQVVTRGFVVCMYKKGWKALKAK